MFVAEYNILFFINSLDLEVDQAGEKTYHENRMPKAGWTMPDKRTGNFSMKKSL